jgi:WD40 repeat protein
LENEATLICFAFSSCGKWIAACYGNWVGLWNRVSSHNNSSSTSNNKNSSSSNNNSNSNSDNSNNSNTNTSEEWKQEALIRGFVGEATCIAWRPGTLEIATGSVDGSTRVWRLQTDPEISVEQVWGIGPVGLVATDAVFEEAIGLSTVNQILLTQRSRNDGKLFADALPSPDQSEYSASSEAEDWD